MAKPSDFDQDVSLPPGLEIGAIRRAVEYIEEKTSELIDLYVEQANVFSALVGIFGTKALSTHSNYEKHRHIDTAQQRFPDLCKRGGSVANPRHCLESKGSKRPWAIQAHYDHPGWYIVWRYLIDPTESLERGKSVVIWRVDVAFLEKRDWKYESSRAGESGGGRTHTFGVKNAARKLRDCAVYCRRDVVIRGGKPVVRNGNHAED